MAKMKILLVDDEPMFIEIMKTRLEADGCEVITASDGKQALDRIAQDKPDAVLLDILMPVLDGMSALEMIRKKDKELPVYMLTAFSTEDRIKEAKRAGASGFLVKDGELKEEIGGIVDQLKKNKS